MSRTPGHLFISYAVEDATLALWLARKLAVREYPGWFEQMCDGNFTDQNLILT